MNDGPYRPLLIAIRVLNASSIHQATPNAEDVDFLRKLTGDHSTPIDELACGIIERALRQKNQPVKTAGATS
jgi:hypothetical protein